MIHVRMYLCSSDKEPACDLLNKQIFLPLLAVCKRHISFYLIDNQ